MPCAVYRRELVKDLRALVTPYAAFDQVDSLVARYNVKKS